MALACRDLFGDRDVLAGRRVSQGLALFLPPFQGLAGLGAGPHRAWPCVSAGAPLGRFRIDLVHTCPERAAAPTWRGSPMDPDTKEKRSPERATAMMNTSCPDKSADRGKNLPRQTSSRYRILWVSTELLLLGRKQLRRIYSTGCLPDHASPQAAHPEPAEN